MKVHVVSLLLFLVLFPALLCGCSDGKTSSSMSPISSDGQTLVELSGLSLGSPADTAELSAETAALYEQLRAVLGPYLVTQSGRGYVLFSGDNFSQEDYLSFLNLYLQQNYEEDAVKIEQNESGQPIWYFERKFYAQEYASLSPLAGMLPKTIENIEIDGVSCVAAPEMGWGSLYLWEIESAAWQKSGNLIVDVSVATTDNCSAQILRFLLQPMEDYYALCSVKLLS